MSGSSMRQLAQTYLDMGGTRLVLIDDNKVFVRQWDDEPKEAHLYWQDHIEPLKDGEREEVMLLLPSVSNEDTGYSQTTGQHEPQKHLPNALSDKPNSGKPNSETE